MLEHDERIRLSYDHTPAWLFFTYLPRPCGVHGCCRTCSLPWGRRLSGKTSAQTIDRQHRRRALAAALGCPPRLLVLRAYRATAPAEIQDLLQGDGVMAPDDPVWQTLTPLFAAVHTLPPATRHQLLQLWQAALALVHGGRVSPPRPPGDQASDACAVDDAMTPYY